MFGATLGAIMKDLIASAVSAIGLCLAANFVQAADSLQPIPLGKVISSLLSPADPDLPWSMGADSSSSIRWTSMGVQTERCGIYAACRWGEARISFDGKKLKNLREKIEPVMWVIFIHSTMPPKFPPQVISLHPHCDTVACEFALGHELESAGFSVEKVCENQAAGYSVTGFRISDSGRIAQLLYATNSGSGGMSNAITLVLTTNTPKDLCTTRH